MAPTITLNATVATIPVDPPPPPSGEETFKIYASLSKRTNQEVLQGDTIDVIEHQGINVYFDDFANWGTDDPRDIITWVDYGERYDFQYLSGAALAPEIRLLQGRQAGFYIGLSSSHAFRGTDMSGVKQIDLTTPTKTQTVTCSASLGAVTKTVTFNIRVVEMSAWYKDRTKSLYGADNQEPQRRGLIYVSRDGDFTGAPAAGPQIYHDTIPDGRFTRSMLMGDQTARGGPDYPWDSVNNMDGVGVVFKGGQEFFLVNAFTLWQAGAIFGSWGVGNATIDVYEAQQWGDAQLIWAVNNAFSDWRFNCFGINWKSNYDPTSPEIREWWNILNYTGKTGTFVPRELLTNATNTAYTEVLYDTGTSLIVRQVVDTADIYEQTNSLAAFSDGETLTATSGAQVTFVAAGSRQARTQRQPAVLWGALMRNCTLDGCSVVGFDEGLSAAGNGNVINDCDIYKCFDYGVYIASRTDIWVGLSGVNIRQPTGYIAEPIPTRLSINGDGIWTPEAVAGNRGEWNVYDATFLNPNVYSDIPVVENRPRHSAMRCPGGGKYSFHKCAVYWYGGHGAAHQPLFRFLTGGTVEPDFTLVTMSGCSMVGGSAPFSGFASVSGFVYPPKAFVVDSCHFRPIDGVGEGTSVLKIELPTTTFRNCLIEYPAGTTREGGASVRYFYSFTTPPQNDPDPGGEFGDVQPADVYAGGKNIVIEGCTFVSLNDFTSPPEVLGQWDNLRSSSILYEWRNNAYIIDPTKVTSIAADLLALNESPANFTADWRPLPAAIAYQSATPPVLKFDAEGTTRPTDGTASAGALEPSP